MADPVAGLEDDQIRWVGGDSAGVGAIRCRCMGGVLPAGRFPIWHCVITSKAMNRIYPSLGFVAVAGFVGCLGDTKDNKTTTSQVVSETSVTVGATGAGGQPPG